MFVATKNIGTVMAVTVSAIGDTPAKARMKLIDRLVSNGHDKAAYVVRNLGVRSVHSMGYTVEEYTSRDYAMNLPRDVRSHLTFRLTDLLISEGMTKAAAYIEARAAVSDNRLCDLPVGLKDLGL